MHPLECPEIALTFTSLCPWETGSQVLSHWSLAFRYDVAILCIYFLKRVLSFPYFQTLHKWFHPVCILPWLAFFTQYFEIYSCGACGCGPFMFAAVCYPTVWTYSDASVLSCIYLGIVFHVLLLQTNLLRSLPCAPKCTCSGVSRTYSKEGNWPVVGHICLQIDTICQVIFQSDYTSCASAGSAELLLLSSWPVFRVIRLQKFLRISF